MAGRVRRQVAALPVAVADGEVRVMLVTSRETGRWVLPKGWPVKGLEAHEAAAREAWEEAGLRGEVSPRPFGAYHYGKRLDDGRIVACEVWVYPMRVEQERPDWPERRERLRRWMTAAQASLAVEEGGLAALLLDLAGMDPAEVAAGPPSR
jgi:8-oxo-dGTP pyrophosphatase MutT (NUDIX family)